MTRLLRDPRVRTVALVILLLLAVGLAWHAVGMDSHAGMEMVGACVAVLVVTAVTLSPRPVLAMVSVRSWSGAQVPSLRVQPPGGRHPPDEGTVLRS